MRYETPYVNWYNARTACANEGHDVRFATFKTSAAAQFIIDDYDNAADGSEFLLL